jgi:hypothetical protein
MLHEEDLLEKELGEALRVIKKICLEMGIDELEPLESEEALDSDRY